MVVCGLELPVFGQGQLAGSYEHVNEFSVS
jgi:hypothetical protein